MVVVGGLISNDDGRKEEAPGAVLEGVAASGDPCGCWCRRIGALFLRAVAKVLEVAVHALHDGRKEEADDSSSSSSSTASILGSNLTNSCSAGTGAAAEPEAPGGVMDVMLLGWVAPQLLRVFVRFVPLRCLQPRRESPVTVPAVVRPCLSRRRCRQTACWINSLPAELLSRSSLRANALISLFWEGEAARVWRNIVQ